MRIAMIATYTVDHLIGGREVHIKALAEGLVKRGHEVSILTTRHPEGILHGNTHELDTYYFYKQQPKICRASYFKDFNQFFKEIDKEHNFDVIHNQQTLMGFSYLKHTKEIRPFISTFHGTTKNDIQSYLNTTSLSGLVMASRVFLRSIYCPVEKITLNKSDKIIAVSNELNEDIKNQNKTLNENKLVTVPNGIDISRFRPFEVDELKDRYNIACENILVCICAIHKQKGVHILLEILPKLQKYYKNIKLVVVGTGPYLNELKSLAIKLNLHENVIFAGKVSEENLPKYYNLADIFVFPTLRMEGLPLVVPEAMACQKPVITSRIGGIPTAIEHEIDGILIEPGNREELVRNILYLLDNQDAAKQLGKRARGKVIKKLSLDKMVDDTIKVYEEVINVIKR